MSGRWRKLWPWTRNRDAGALPAEAEPTPVSLDDPEYREFMDGGATSSAIDELFAERLRRRLRAMLAPRYWKAGLASSFDVTGLNRAGVLVQKQLLWPWARALNYHDVPAKHAPAFEEQLRFFARHFVAVGPAELAELHAGRWSHSKPGLLLTFDDGLRCHADVVAPLLEKHGFTGWFTVPVGFVETPPAEQRAFAQAHQITCDDSDLPDERIAMSWSDLQRLDANHEVCCHTWSHRRLGPQITQAELDLEIDQAKRALEQGLGHEVRSFAWVGGEESSYSREAAERIRAAGFDVSFMTNNALIRPHAELLQVHRTNVEAHFDPALMRLCLSGFYDVLYLPKRRRVNRLTAAAA